MVCTDDCISRYLFTLFEEYIEQCTRNDEYSFVNSYIKSFGPEYDREQLNFLLRDFIFAGSETTKTVILWSLIYLSNNQEWQRRLQAQVILVGLEVKLDRFIPSSFSSIPFD